MKKEKFEDHLAAVEDAVQKLERGELPLEDALAQYEAGIKSLKQCYAILEAAEKKVEILLKGGGGEPELQPLDAKKTEDVEREQCKTRKAKPQAEAAPDASGGLFGGQ